MTEADNNLTPPAHSDTQMIFEKGLNKVAPNLHSSENYANIIPETNLNMTNNNNLHPTTHNDCWITELSLNEASSAADAFALLDHYNTHSTNVKQNEKPANNHFNDLQSVTKHVKIAPDDGNSRSCKQTSHSQTHSCSPDLNSSNSSKFAFLTQSGIKLIEPISSMKLLTPEQMQLLKAQPKTTCCICFKRFSSNSVLETHYQSHTQMRPLTCHICECEFSVKETLKRHMTNHKKTGKLLNHVYVNTSICPICNFESIISKKEMKLHMRHHETNKPFVPPLVPSALPTYSTSMLFSRVQYMDSNKAIIGTTFPTDVDKFNTAYDHKNTPQSDTVDGFESNISNSVANAPTKNSEEHINIHYQTNPIPSHSSNNADLDYEGDMDTFVSSSCYIHGGITCPNVTESSNNFGNTCEPLGTPKFNNLGQSESLISSDYHNCSPKISTRDEFDDILDSLDFTQDCSELDIISAKDCADILSSMDLQPSNSSAARMITKLDSFNSVDSDKNNTDVINSNFEPNFSNQLFSPDQIMQDAIINFNRTNICESTISSINPEIAHQSITYPRANDLDISNTNEPTNSSVIAESCHPRNFLNIGNDNGNIPNSTNFGNSNIAVEISQRRINNTGLNYSNTSKNNITFNSSIIPKDPLVRRIAGTDIANCITPATYHHVNSNISTEYSCHTKLNSETINSNLPNTNNYSIIASILSGISQQNRPHLDSNNCYPSNRISPIISNITAGISQERSSEIYSNTNVKSIVPSMTVIPCRNRHPVNECQLCYLKFASAMSSKPIGGKLFKCIICQRAFRTKRTMKLHRKTHYSTNTGICNALVEL